MRRAAPWIIALVCALGWLFAAHPEWAPWRLFGLATPGIVGATPRERMLRQWEAAGFDSTALGRAWLTAGRTALDSPAARALPLAERIYFGPEPRAFGYRLIVPTGRTLVIKVDGALSEGEALVELYTRGLDELGEVAYALEEVMPRGRDSLRVEVDEATTFVLRVEAAPLATGSLVVRAGTDPQLPVFPVSGGDRTDVGGVWGDSRGRGARRHEGIDIFHPRGTPLVAARGGLVTRVRNRGLGGKQVWLRLPDRGLSLYYAHLDSQYVRSGQRVRPGDTLGTVGNTGNARTTPPHLHFGIYGRGGAIDPLPWVSPGDWLGAPLDTLAAELLAGGVRTRRRTRLFDDAGLSGESVRLAAKQFARPTASAGAAVAVALPTGERGWVARADVEPLTTPTNETPRPGEGTEGAEVFARAFADERYPSGRLPAGVVPEVLAQAGEWRLVRTPGGLRGWWRP